MCGEINVEGENEEDNETDSIEANKRKREKEKKGENRQKDYKVKYIGETWRTGYERGREHMEDLQQIREGSHMLKHILEDHPGKKMKEIKFGIRIKQTFRSALERQVSEAVSIHQAQRDGYKLMNSKSEYSRCIVPRIKIENNKELLERLIGEKEKERRTNEEIRNMRKRKDDPLATVCD